MVNILFDYITDAQVDTGYTDYRKCHIKNTGVATGTIIVRPVLILPDGLIDYLSVKIAIGTPTDDISSKPEESAFAASISTSIVKDGYLPIWLKRTMLADTQDNNYYTGIKIALVVSV